MHGGREACTVVFLLRLPERDEPFRCGGWQRRSPQQSAGPTDELIKISSAPLSAPRSRRSSSLTARRNGRPPPRPRAKGRGAGQRCAALAWRLDLAMRLIRQIAEWRGLPKRPERTQ
jgi:hypothetical protein